MRLLQLRYFLKIAQNKNISKTARELHVSQPSLSRTMKELEEELGIELFIRKGHTITLSQAGILFERQVNLSVNQLDTAVQSVSHMSGSISQRITLKFETSSALLPGLLQRLHTKYPNLHIDLEQHGVEAGGLDNYDFSFSTLPLNKYDSVRLLHEEVYIAVNSALPYQNGDTIIINDLKKYPIIMGSPSPLRTEIENKLREQGFYFHPIFESGDRETIHGLVENNAGICFWPAYSWPDTSVSNVNKLHLAPHPLMRDIYLNFIRPKKI
ncbi:LysR family transcriptional regulator [Secundilactobacillus collinoides]|uniref:LysR family transcriptional regulator n=1 Tax=Secundilactobacillus collinoides TaxID=33960 RepID=UPI0006CFF0C4|nr:LysR family transcriptional regulator [Secundilactobacillus collinoides]